MKQAASDREAVRSFLAERHGSCIDDLEPLEGGFWSRAWGYRVSGADRVARFGAEASWYEADARATAFSNPDLPVPMIHEMGTSPWGPFAISTRHFGRFLEEIPADDAPALSPTLTRLLVALQAAPGRHGPVVWHESPTNDLLGWRGWLAAALEDSPGRPQHGWRATVARDRQLDLLFRAAEARIKALAVDCPERRDLVHGDLLHKNVLVCADASSVEAVFSWKCSLRGDYLFDAAWCEFWSDWHPGIAAARPAERLLAAPSLSSDPGALDGVLERLHCYMLHIGATHLGWCIYVDDDVELRKVAKQLSRLVEAGVASVE